MGENEREKESESENERERERESAKGRGRGRWRGIGNGRRERKGKREREREGGRREGAGTHRPWLPRRRTETGGLALHRESRRPWHVPRTQRSSRQLSG